ncbi:MAG TPA: SpoIIE family protein phosphatase [Stellaceae bacterium]|jgi:serine phosphatase RsbU (regulator of sigma subunit)|nr:SpoIIE family protein phosphatase [Stellaceae bacterium]
MVQPTQADVPAREAPPVEEIARLLALHPIFDKFDPVSLLAVAARCGFDTFPVGATIMRQGEHGTFAYMIVEGAADIFVEIPGDSIHMATVGPPVIIGELGALTDMPRTATVVVNAPLAVVRIERDRLIALTVSYPSISAGVIDELGHRLHDMNHSLAYLTYAATALKRDEYDPVMLDELTNQPGALAAFARVFADMATEIRAKQSRRQEMQAAATIQNSILPPPLTRKGPTEAIDLHAEMHPAREIGGDFYDFFVIDDTHLALTLADVSGKGIPAALFMAVSRTVLRTTGGVGQLASRMAAANQLLATENAACMFVTTFHGVLDMKTGVLTYCNAGHNPPYLLRAEGGFETLGATGIPFGVMTDMPYRTAEATLRPGDTLFVYSDGITEAFNPEGQEFTTHRLEAALAAAHGGSAADIVARVLADTNNFANGAEQSDDITGMALVFQGPG